MIKLNSNELGFGVIEGVLILVFVGLIGFVGWYVWHNRATNTANTPSANATSSKPKTTAKSLDAKVDETAGWTSYNNAAIGITFKYPSEWKVQEVLPCSENSSATGQECAVNLTWKASADKYPPTISIERLSHSYSSLEKYYDDYYAQSDLNKVTKETIQVQGKSATKYTVVNSGNTSKQILIKSGDKVFNFFSVNEASSAQGLNYQDAFDKIFNTFNSIN